MIGKSFLTCSLLIPALALVSGTVPDSRAEHRPTNSAAAVEFLDDESSAEAMSCTFAIRASNNLSFDVWVDLYDSTVRLDSWSVPYLLRKDKKLKIQNHRLATGKSMDRRYTASGSCSTKRSWTLLVRIGRADGKKIYESLVKGTSGTTSSSRTVNLGKSSTWGL
jgi:hypothetical protein